LDADAATAHRPSEPMTYERLVASGPLRGRASVVGVAESEPLLRHRTALSSADIALRELELLPARSALALASALIGEAAARNEATPLAQLEAGLALDAVGEHTAAARRLRAARNLHNQSDGASRQATADPFGHECNRWASHHLGRILYQHGGDLNEAVSALTEANRRAPEDPSTAYHLGLAIYTLVQRESLRDVERHLQAYLDSGAPLGHIDQVEQIIDSIEST
jgi:tetratricopeptide (TPR) repeat protein